LSISIAATRQCLTRYGKHVELALHSVGNLDATVNPWHEKEQTHDQNEGWHPQPKRQLDNRNSRCQPVTR
jgi:hypothetical protein